MIDLLKWLKISYLFTPGCLFHPYPHIPKSLNIHPHGRTLIFFFYIPNLSLVGNKLNWHFAPWRQKYVLLLLLCSFLSIYSFAFFTGTPAASPVSAEGTCSTTYHQISHQTYFKCKVKLYGHLIMNSLQWFDFKIRAHKASQVLVHRSTLPSTSKLF